MKIHLPTHPSQVSLKWYIDFMNCVDDIERVIVISKWRRKDVMQLKPETITEVVETFRAVTSLASGTELNRHVVRRFGLLWKSLSFIPDLPGMSTGEHIDLDMYAKSVFPTEGEKPNHSKLWNLMAVLYRPRTRIFFKRYQLKKYDSTDMAHFDRVGDIDMDTVNRALLFFSTIEGKLRQNLNGSLLERATQALETANKEARKLSRNVGVGYT